MLLLYILLSFEFDRKVEYSVIMQVESLPSSYPSSSHETKLALDSIGKCKSRKSIRFILF